MNENINTCTYVGILTYIIPVATPKTGFYKDLTGNQDKKLDYTGLFPATNGHASTRGG